MKRAVFLLLLAACGGGTAGETGSGTDGGAAIAWPSADAGSNDDPSTKTCDLRPGPACKAARHVTTVAELAAVANAVPLIWPYQGGVQLIASDDVVADANLEIGPNDLEPPGSCGADACKVALSAVGYPHSTAVNGVTCNAPLADAPTRCTTVVIAKGATFRVRRINQVTLPPIAGFDATHLLEFVEPCTQACAPGQMRCGATNTCLAPGSEWCLSCEGRDPRYCACRDDTCNPKPAGTTCQFITGDSGQSGTCTAAGCTGKR